MIHCSMPISHLRLLSLLALCFRWRAAAARERSTPGAEARSVRRGKVQMKPGVQRWVELLLPSPRCRIRWT